MKLSERLLGIVSSFKKLTQRRFIKFGVPFLTLTLAGSFGLKYFASLRYEFRKNEMLTPEYLAKYGIKKKPPEEITLEKEYEKLKKVDLDSWENIRGPRPWEENSEYMKIIKEKTEAAKKHQKEKELSGQPKPFYY